MAVITRVGLPIPGGSLLRHVAKARLPALVSANAFYVRDKDGPGRFRLPKPGTFDGLDVALDSGGYVAMKQYGYYSWSPEEYLDLAASAPWCWYASLDLCVEPDIAQNDLELQLRLAGTVANYGLLCRLASDRGMNLPLAVLQGWTARQYLWCVDKMGLDMPPAAPTLIGVGSMCRRNVAGPQGIVAIVEALDKALAPGISLHLFGVKSDGLAALAGHPRLASIDSCAWDYSLRMDMRVGRDMEMRTLAIDDWYCRQQVKQLQPYEGQSFVDVEAILQEPFPDKTCGYADLVLTGAIEYQDAKRYAMRDPQVLLASLPKRPEFDDDAFGDLEADLEFA